MDKKFSRDYECPVCSLKAWLIKVLGLKEEGSEKLPFFSTIVQEMKLNGLCPPDWGFAYDAKRGGVCSEDMLKSAPIGCELPAYDLQTEICAVCGTVYAKHLARGAIKKKPGLSLPNRAMRRQMQRGEGI